MNRSFARRSAFRLVAVIAVFAPFALSIGVLLTPPPAQARAESPYKGNYSGDLYGPSGQTVIAKWDMTVKSDGSVSGAFTYTFTSISLPTVSFRGKISPSGELDVRFSNPASGNASFFRGPMKWQGQDRLRGTLESPGDSVILDVIR